MEEQEQSRGRNRKERYERILQTAKTAGWRDIIENVTQNREKDLKLLSRIDVSRDTAMYLRGRIDALDWIENLPEATKPREQNEQEEAYKPRSGREMTRHPERLINEEG